MKRIATILFLTVALSATAEDWILTSVFGVPEEIVNMAMDIVFYNRVTKTDQNNPDSPVLGLQMSMMSRFAELQETSPFPEARICLWAAILTEMYIGIRDSRADSNTILKMYLDRLQPHFTEADRVFYRLMGIF